MDNDHEIALKVHREINTRSRISTKSKESDTFCRKSQNSAIVRKLTAILKKPAELRSSEEQDAIDNEDSKLVEEALKRLQKRNVQVARLEEQEDAEDELIKKCLELKNILLSSKHLVVYTGAGISTSASIPDYRGPQGIWTMLRKGQDLQTNNSLTSANPTVTHMAISELYRRGVVKHIVFQNCDGLHLRSGIPRDALSEVHGNMYIEVCNQCAREYVRSFDVTENTRKRDHRTGRVCYACGSVLKDTIVHFGERGSLKWPLNWSGAERSAKQADVILCLGSSLKFYEDIHGFGVMEMVNIQIPLYSRPRDPLFIMSTPLHHNELESKSTKGLEFPDCSDKQSISSIPVTDGNYTPFNPVFASEVLQMSALIYSKTRAKRGNGAGWLGNAWGARPKKQKKKRQ